MWCLNQHFSLMLWMPSRNSNVKYSFSASSSGQAASSVPASLSSDQSMESVSLSSEGSVSLLLRLPSSVWRSTSGSRCCSACQQCAAPRPGSPRMISARETVLKCCGCVGTTCPCPCMRYHSGTAVFASLPLQWWPSPGQVR